MSLDNEVLVTIADEQWDEVRTADDFEELEPGQEAPTWTRLSATMRINSTPFHVTAIAVKDDEGGDQHAEHEDDESDLDRLFEMAGDSPFYTTTIRGREYVIWIEPFCN